MDEIIMYPKKSIKCVPPPSLQTCERQLDSTWLHRIFASKIFFPPKVNCSVLLWFKAVTETLINRADVKNDPFWIILNLAVMIMQWDPFKFLIKHYRIICLQLHSKSFESLHLQHQQFHCKLHWFAFISYCYELLKGKSSVKLSGSKQAFWLD